MLNIGSLIVAPPRFNVGCGKVNGGEYFCFVVVCVLFYVLVLYFWCLLFSLVVEILLSCFNLFLLLLCR